MAEFDPNASPYVSPVEAGQGQTSQKAVWSLVLGLLSFCCLLAGIPGLVLGIMAKSEIRISAGRLTGSGMATAGIILSAVGTFLSVIGILISLLLPAVQAAREAGRRAACSNNLRTISVALHQYHDQHGCFPPQLTLGGDGKPMHSWRALILPQLDPVLAQQYHYDEPWDGPNNRQLADRMPAAFSCPSDSDQGNHTDYVAVVGPETMWPGETCTSVKDITDGTSNTIMVVEVRDLEVGWLEPSDVLMSDLYEVLEEHGVGALSHHPGRANAAFADASVRFLDHDWSADHVAAQLTIAGGEPAVPSPP